MRDWNAGVDHVAEELPLDRVTTSDVFLRFKESVLDEKSDSCIS